MDIAQFYIAGINYKKADAEARGKFTINQKQYDAVLAAAPFYNISSMFILSTCNRTEIYGLTNQVDDMISLLCSQTNGSKNDFIRLGYIKTGKEAITHLFNVAAGLDSQILGDYEIVGQLKQATKFAKERGFINCFLERLVNGALQSSKKIKNETLLSSGSVSVAFAAARFIKENVKNYKKKKILIIGVGKIGINTCKNLVDYLGATNITLINRSADKATELAAQLNLNYASISDLNDQLESSDIILVATNADSPVVLYNHLIGAADKLIIDLSIPCNVETSVQGLKNITLVGVDELSKLQDETLRKREMEMPKAKRIIAESIVDFMKWHCMRKNAPVLNAIKLKLVSIKPQTEVTGDKTIQRILNKVAGKMLNHGKIGCHYIEAINEYMVAI